MKSNKKQYPTTEDMIEKFRQEYSFLPEEELQTLISSTDFVKVSEAMIQY